MFLDFFTKNFPLMESENSFEVDRVQKFFHDLEAQKHILSTCTQLFTTISNHFTSLQHSLSQKIQFLDSRILALEVSSRETLESLSFRENSIPERESAALLRIEEQKKAAFAEFEKPISRNSELSETLKSYCRKMDSSQLLRFIISKRKESIVMRAEMVDALAEAVDSPRLVLDALEDFVNAKSSKLGVTDKRWACGMLIQALFPEIIAGSKTKPKFSSTVVENAARILESWKGQMDCDSSFGALGPAEAVIFLQLVVGFQLRSRFDDEFIKKLIMQFAMKRDMAKLAAALESSETLGDIIEELIKKGKEIEAVYFASEAGLTERFPILPMIKSYLRNTKKNAATISKNGNNSITALEESHAMELNSSKAIIKCVEDHKLEPEFSLESLRKRVSYLEKIKSERKKNSGPTKKPQNKRGLSGGSDRGGGHPFRPAKGPKYSNNPYPSFNRRNHSIPQHSPAPRYPTLYNYPSPNVYEGPPPASYPSGYAMLHNQQHYSRPADDVAAVGFRSSGPYSAQSNYGSYDQQYSNTDPTTYQP